MFTFVFNTRAKQTCILRCNLYQNKYQLTLNSCSHWDFTILWKYSLCFLSLTISNSFKAGVMNVRSHFFAGNRGIPQKQTKCIIFSYIFSHGSVLKVTYSMQWRDLFTGNPVGEDGWGTCKNNNTQDDFIFWCWSKSRAVKSLSFEKTTHNLLEVGATPSQHLCSRALFVFTLSAWRAACDL